MKPQYAPQVDRSVVKSFQTPLRRQDALATMSSFAHFIHTNMAPIFSRSLVYVRAQSEDGKKNPSARPAESVTSVGKWRSPGRDTEQGFGASANPLNAKGFRRDKPIKLFRWRRGAWKARSASRRVVPRHDNDGQTGHYVALEGLPQGPGRPLETRRFAEDEL